MRELQNNPAHTFTYFLNLSCWHLIILRCNNFQRIFDAHARAVWCSWCMLEWLSYPYDELVIARAIIDRERICVASRFLTTKIPSAPLAAVMWLQHTWCPRFHRGTFGYGITTSQTREVEYEYGVSMRMHVNASQFPKCICHAVHAQKQHLF
jgi:ribosomal protein S27E